jgi:serine/threonine protein kinase
MEGLVLAGGFRAWERLGVGARCETWLAWSPSLWCAAVVKLPRPDMVAHPRARLSLKREVAALQENPHPVLPRLYVDGSSEPLPYVAMEYVDGPALDEEADDHGKLDSVDTALLGAQLLSGLAALHRRGIAHVDVKPENIVLRDARPMLIDFGSARPIGASQPPGRPVGTLGYAAPEMEACQPISAAMDVYGVGATLREVLCEPVGPVGPVAELLARMLAPSPQDRPTVEQCLRALGAAVPEDLCPWPAWA